MRNSTHITHVNTAFEVWTGQGTWFWYVVNPQRDCGTIGAAATETEAIREARSSIEEMSAHAGHVLPPRGSLAMPPRSKNPI
jgi:hypothetical protein